jgi:hypothetical protein
MPQSRIQFMYSLLVYTLILRLLPYVLQNCDIKTDPSVLYYPWNFSPLTAICLFGGAYLADRRLSFLLPVATLFISNLGIIALTGRADWVLPVNQQGVFELDRLGSWAMPYLCYAAAVGMGMLLRNSNPRRRLTSALGLGLLFEVAFFALTNLLVWKFGMMADGNPYPQSAEGFILCYTMALPFVGKSLLATFVFTLLLFSPMGARAAAGSDNESLSGDLAPVRVK